MSVTPIEGGKKRRGRPPGSGRGTEEARIERNREICRLYAEKGLSFAEIGRRFDLDGSAVSRIIHEHLESRFPEAERRVLALAQIARYEALLVKWMPRATFSSQMTVTDKEGFTHEVPIDIEGASKAAKVVLDVMGRIDKRYRLDELALEDPDDGLGDEALKAELAGLVARVENRFEDDEDEPPKKKRG